MRAKALRLPDRLLHAVKFAEKKEKLDEPNTLRKFLWLGAEKYVADSYAQGEVTLREAADVLGISAREALELFWDMGVSGNASADQALKSIMYAGDKAGRKKR